MIAFDYSMSAPCMCMDEYGKLEFYYIIGNKKLVTTFEHGGMKVEGILYDPRKESHTETQRFVTLASIFAEIIQDIEPTTAVFEAYAFAAKGRLAHIGENTGTMKAVLACMGWSIDDITPNQVKKIATGHGNADKEMMADAWNERFGFHVHDAIGCKKGSSPASDVIDSFYVKTSYENLFGSNLVGNVLD